MNADPKGMARVLRMATKAIAGNTRAFTDEVADILSVAAALENVIEDAPAGDATATADPSPSDGWAALDWYFENVYSTDERIDNEAGVTLHWVNLRTNKAEQTKGADWRDAITKAMREAKASEQGSEVTNGND